MMVVVYQQILVASTSLMVFCAAFADGKVLQIHQTKTKTDIEEEKTRQLKKGNGKNRRKGREGKE